MTNVSRTSHVKGPTLERGKTAAKEKTRRATEIDAPGPTATVPVANRPHLCHAN